MLSQKAPGIPQLVSQANVEIVRQVFGAAARPDRATVLGLCDPEVELDPSRVSLSALTGQSLYHGHEGLRSLFRDRYGSFELYGDDYDELIDAGEHVISLVAGRGRASRAAVEWPNALVWTIRDGKIVRLAWFPTREEALEAVGHSER